MKYKKSESKNLPVTIVRNSQSHFIYFKQNTRDYQRPTWFKVLLLTDNMNNILLNNGN
jgi:hypothetical protein